MMLNNSNFATLQVCKEEPGQPKDMYWHLLASFNLSSYNKMLITQLLCCLWLWFCPWLQVVADGLAAVLDGGAGICKGADHHQLRGPPGGS